MNQYDNVSENLMEHWARCRPEKILRSAAQRIGVQRPATALAGLDPLTEVCRQIAAAVNRTELPLVR